MHHAHIFLVSVSVFRPAIRVRTPLSGYATQRIVAARPALALSLSFFHSPTLNSFRSSLPTLYEK